MKPQELLRLFCEKASEKNKELVEITATYTGSRSQCN